MFKKLSLIAGLAALTTALAVATAGATTAPVSVSLSGTQTVVDESRRDIHDAREPRGRLADHEVRAALPVRLADRRDGHGAVRRLRRQRTRTAPATRRRPAGTLKFTFMYWASFDPSTGALIHGNCVHPIDGGSGSFRKASGVIFMEDTPTATGVVTTYTGTLEYQAAKSGQAAAHRTLASASARGQPRRGVLMLICAARAARLRS